MKSEAIYYLCTIMRNEWQRKLRSEASAHHMCEENRVALGSVETKHDAIALYKRTIDWALEEGYPDLATIRQYFSDCECEGIFVDKEFNGDLLLDQPVYVFHNCRGSIRVGLNIEKRIIPMLYFANGCDMEVKGIEGAGGASRVPLYVFGSNRITAEQSEDVICTTLKHAVK